MGRPYNTDICKPSIQIYRNPSRRAIVHYPSFMVGAWRAMPHHFLIHHVRQRLTQQLTAGQHVFSGDVQVRGDADDVAVQTALANQ